MHPSSHSFKVEYLTRLALARSAFCKRIVERIPHDITIRDRNSNCDVRHGEKKYNFVHDRFSAEVSDEHSCNILTFLYQVERYFKDDIELFAHYYKSFFDEMKWNSLVYNFPRLNQSEIADIMDLSETTIGTRLDHLDRIGIVERARLKPPHPRHARITAAGIEVVEAAIYDGISHLAPLLGPIQESTTPTAPPSSDAQERPQIP